MNNKFRHIKQIETGEVEKEYKILKEISDELKNTYYKKNQQINRRKN